MVSNRLKRPYFVHFCMKESKAQCPVCGKSFTLRGLHGHLRFEHSYSVDEASEVLEGVKRQEKRAKQGENKSAAQHSQREPQPDPGPPHRDPVRKPQRPRDDIDAALQELIDRRIQRERISTVGELSEGEKRNGGSEVSQLKEAVEVVSAIQDMSSDDGGLTAEDIRGIVRAESSAVADGSGHTPITAAIESGVTDPEALAEIASVQPAVQRSEKKYQLLEKVVDSFAGSGAIETMGEFASVLAESAKATEPPVASEPTHGPRTGDERTERKTAAQEAVESMVQNDIPDEEVVEEPDEPDVEEGGKNDE